MYMRTVRALILQDNDFMNIKAGQVISVPDNDYILFSGLPMLFLDKSDPQGIAAITNYKLETIDRLKKYKDLVIKTNFDGTHICGGLDGFQSISCNIGKVPFNKFITMFPHENEDFLDSLYAQFIIDYMKEEHNILHIKMREKDAVVVGTVSFCCYPIDETIPIDKLDDFLGELTLPF